MEHHQQQQPPVATAGPLAENNGDDDVMMEADQEAAGERQEEQDDQDVMDGTPLFLNPEDAVEVQVDEDNVPMDEDDDDDDLEDVTDFDNEMQREATAALRNKNVVDMSNLTLSSHSGHVYAVESFYDNNADSSSCQLLVVSGGGDDKAYLHHISIPEMILYPTTTTPTPTQASTAANVPVPAQPAAVPKTTMVALDYAHKDSVSCVALNLPYLPTSSSPTLMDAKKFPRVLAVGSYDGAIVLYNPDTGAQLSSSQDGNSSNSVLEGPTDVECMAWHPKGGQVLLAGSAADGTLWMYHVPMRKCLQVFVGHESAVTACRFTLDGKFALSASSDGTIRLWAPRTGLCKHVFRFHESSSDDPPPGLTCMAMNGGLDGQLIVVGAEDGQAHVCHVGSKKIIASLRHYEIPPAKATATATAMQQQQDDDDDEQDENSASALLPMSVEAVGFASPTVNPNWCATGGVDGIVKIWDLANNAQCRQICQVPPAPTTTTTAAATTASLQPIAEEERVVDPNASTTVNNNNGDNKPGGITRLQWHPTLPVVFTADTVGISCIWDARSGKLLQSLTGHTDVINDMNITYIKQEQRGLDNSSSNAAATAGEAVAVIVSASDDKTVRVFVVDVASLLLASSATAVVAAAVPLQR